MRHDCRPCGWPCRSEEGSDPTFVCERVCTSDRLLRRMGGLSKDPTPNTCVTVCGISGQSFLPFGPCATAGSLHANLQSIPQPCGDWANGQCHMRSVWLTWALFRHAATDSCEDACQRAVCANMHQVPAWNQSCLKRCSNSSGMLAAWLPAALDSAVGSSIVLYTPVIWCDLVCLGGVQVHQRVPAWAGWMTAGIMARCSGCQYVESRGM